eukprot:TRINITY_DN6131_c0_g1_i8.p1 TRINITY_DN6131_c0_g1~~TRINITY_DN6131_c0_g1_i8.p1  ORF type:complete len:394 (-),score=26.47 TRINITY_DN6131_c0_g1_i8:560-1741(-)
MEDQQECNRTFLPGQILSTDQSTISMQQSYGETSDKFDSDALEFMSQDNLMKGIKLESNEEDFDIEKFREIKTDTKIQAEIKPAKIDYQNRRAKHGEIYRYLGIKFYLELLQQRNKDPKILLNTLVGSIFIGCSFALYLFIYGTNFSIVPSVLITVSVSLSFIAFPLNLNSSVENGINFKSWGCFFIALCMSFWSLALIYCFIRVVPFGSVSIFLLYLEVQSFLACIIIFCEFVPCKISWEDEFYQTKYFMSLCLLSSLNATGLIDVLSDIVLGVEIILNFSGFLQILGFSLFFLCLMDLLIVSIRIAMPQKVTIKMHVIAFVLELGILTVTLIAIFQANSNSKEVESDLKMLIFLSVATTCINFAHHTFIVCDSFVALRNHRQPRNLATMFS